MTKPLLLLLGFMSLIAVAGRASAADAAPLWVTQGFAQPASAIYAADEKAIYVSNANGDPAARDGNGFISKLSADGKLLKLDWVGGLDAPKGLAYAQGKLLVVDIAQLVVIDTRTAQVSKRYPAPGANLTDIALNYHSHYRNQIARGYASDTDGHALWYLGDGGLSRSVADSSLEHPRGLTFDKDDLRFVTAGPAGHIKAMGKDEDRASDWSGAAALGDLTSIEPDGKGGYWVSEGSSGRIWRVSPSGMPTLWLNAGAGAGDIGQIPGKTLLVPMTSGELRAYALPQ